MHSRRFLIIEDEPVVAKALAGFLGQFATCDVASHGFDGVNRFYEALASGQPYTGVFLDMMMPVIGGLEVLALLRRIEEEASGSHKSVIMMTTGVEISEVAGERDLWHQCDGYITKPIDWRSLHALLEQLGLGVGASQAHA